jgi:hypothetical protein
VALHRITIDRASVGQTKTGHSVRVELSGQCMTP